MTDFLAAFKGIGNQFVFDLFVESQHETIIKKLREFLAPITPEIVHKMVTESTYPVLTAEQVEAIRKVEPWYKYIKQIGSSELAEAIAEARPDLAEMIISFGDTGGEYVRNLRVYFLRIIRGVYDGNGKPITEIPAAPAAADNDLVKVTCTKCNWTDSIAREAAKTLTECPNCHDKF
jgi:ssDNA-binding Zn-finger/Zn-ribbon topoisomerase 1